MSWNYYLYFSEKSLPKASLFQTASQISFQMLFSWLSQIRYVEGEHENKCLQKVVESISTVKSMSANRAGNTDKDVIIHKKICVMGSYMEQGAFFTRKVQKRTGKNDNWVDWDESVWSERTVSIWMSCHSPVMITKPICSILNLFSFVADAEESLGSENEEQ